MLTPIDIQKKEFEVKFRGYDSADVDLFLDMVAQDYEKLYKENIELKDKISMLTEAVDNYKAMETTLRDSIILAQKSAEEIRKNAAEQSESVLREARLKAEEMRVQAQNDISHLTGKIEALRMETDAYKVQIKSLCAGICDMLDKESYN